MQIAIDGPAGSGKTSLGRALASHFGALFVETGKMYRAVALGFERDISLDEMVITTTDEGRFFLNGEDVTELLHTANLDQSSSKAATQPKVREKLVQLQRRIAANRDVVMEGRDIGTVVLPGAGAKIFLQAGPQERAQRRAAERLDTDLSATLNDILARDKRDRTRSISPLNPACDAIIIDTNHKSLAEVISEAIDLIKERLGGP